MALNEVIMVNYLSHSSLQNVSFKAVPDVVWPELYKEKPLREMLKYNFNAAKIMFRTKELVRRNGYETVYTMTTNFGPFIKTRF